MRVLQKLFNLTIDFVILSLISFFQVFPIVSLIMLALCYLPGIIAAFFQLYRGTKYRSDIKTPWTDMQCVLKVQSQICSAKSNSVCFSRFPDWLDRWMLCRKQLGLVALGFASLHVLYTLIIPLRYVNNNNK